MTNDPSAASIDQIENPLFARSLEYWNSLREGDRLPGRQHIRPQDIVEILPHIVLNDVIPGTPVRYRYRLVGTRVAEYYGFDPTGRMLEDVATGAFYESVVEAFDRCRRTRTTIFEGVRKTWPAVVQYSRLVLPLADDGETVDIIMVIVASSTDPIHRNPMRDFFHQNEPVESGGSRIVPRGAR